MYGSEPPGGGSTPEETGRIGAEMMIPFGPFRLRLTPAVPLLLTGCCFLTSLLEAEEEDALAKLENGKKRGFGS